MKIFECTTFYSEHLMMDLRFNILNEYVEKFIVCESTISHSGKKKKLNFDINNYPKFKDKISYIIIDEEPEDIIGLKNGLAKPHEKRLDSLKRINLSYDYMIKEIDKASDNDLIMPWSVLKSWWVNDALLNKLLIFLLTTGAISDE